MKVDNAFLDALSQERCNAIARALAINAPTERWRSHCRTIICRVLRGYCPWPQEDERFGSYSAERPLTVRLKEAYPFGERKYHPYKMWLADMKTMRDMAIVITGELTNEMRDVIEVARDAEEEATEKSLAAAKAMISGIDYPIFWRKCGVCGREGVASPCVDINTLQEMIVPHKSRLPAAIQQPTDADLPLFA